MNQLTFLVVICISFPFAVVRAGKKHSSYASAEPVSDDYGGGGNCAVTGNLNQDSLLNMHNQMRATVGAAPLSWDNSLAQTAQCWANRCAFEHSHTQGLGENIACGNGHDYDAESGVQQWWDEWKQWQPGMDFTEATGHFTQMAWKDTTAVGCGVAKCNSDSLGLGTSNYYPHAEFVVCEYSPPGNVIGNFDGEVSLPSSDSYSPTNYDESDDYSPSNSNNDAENNSDNYGATSYNPDNSDSYGGGSNYSPDYSDSYGGSNNHSPDNSDSYGGSSNYSPDNSDSYGGGGGGGGSNYSPDNSDSYGPSSDWSFQVFENEVGPMPTMGSGSFKKHKKNRQKTQDSYGTK